MKNIQDVDKNFVITTEIGKEDLALYNCLAEPFRIYGVFYEDGKFRRLPESVALATSETVHYLHSNTAGGRVRFRTNSSYVAIFTKMEKISKSPHFALTGTGGFDLYADDGSGNRYIGTYKPPQDIQTGYQSVIELGSAAFREITIHFPLYSDVQELIIGISDTAELAAPAPYRDRKPIIYYGSSITQGGCASRPGNAYQNIITRANGIDHINLGFSGSAKAEQAMYEYIRDLEMSLFVYDYDYNAPNVEHLANTHETMFQAIRAQQPQLPIIILSRPKLHLDAKEQQRLQIIETTYQNALAAGDRNVYFIKGSELMAGTNHEGTVDGVHPNDYGFYSIARVLGACIHNVLGL